MFINVTYCFICVIRVDRGLFIFRLHIDYYKQLSLHLFNDVYFNVKRFFVCLKIFEFNTFNEGCHLEVKR
jgi:hypothetical protein